MTTLIETEIREIEKNLKEMIDLVSSMHTD